MREPLKRRTKASLPVAPVIGVAIVGLGLLVFQKPAEGEIHPYETLLRQTAEEASEKSRGCLSCHGGIEPMHASTAVNLGCTDCHGGDPTAVFVEGGDSEAVKRSAHVQPNHPERWSRNGRRSAANPQRTYTDLNDESPEFIRFINPGDLRVAPEACGVCHPSEVNRVPRSTMATATTFWTAAAYANGILDLKYGVLGEYYTREGEPGAIMPESHPREPEPSEGTVPAVVPLPRWELTQPGEYFRAFERGGLFQLTTPPEIGNPNVFEDPGRPDIRVSTRGRGTGLRISPALINLHKTRLNDPHLSFLGTNDHPGDYRSSGCSACHVVYANDRDPLHSGPWAKFGHTGLTATDDPTIPRDEEGHPIRHRLTRSIPTSQCMSCHMHQPNSFINTFLGYTMWDYETDADLLFPEDQRYPTEAEERASLDHNPEGAAVRGLWTDVDFLENVRDLNPRADHTQFADYHGHGWIFQAVYKRDRQGRLLDEEGDVVSFDDPEKFDKAVHLRDIHLERGMHCVDCHFDVDSHGNGMIHSDYAAAIEIECRDCHGTVERTTSLRTSGPAAPPGGTDLSLGTTPFGKRRFEWRGDLLFQRSMLREDLEWPVLQVRHVVDAEHADYNEKAARAKTLQHGGKSWGKTSDTDQFVHTDADMTCDSCHSSWITSCSGCHLPQEANARSEMIRYEGKTTRNYASYNPQVIRTDAYMLGISGVNKGHRITPVRSSSALVLSSTNPNRERIYIQQPTISAPGFNGQAFNPHVPHTVRTRETKRCTDCHLSEANDNNAWMAQLLLQGTDWVNFIGRYAWVAEGEEGFEAIAVTEWDEPQAVIGSSLHEVVYPDFHEEHVERDRELELAHHHHGHGVTSIQLRGEYLFTAQGHDGMIVYDVANVDNKGFSERIVSAPVSPFGQRTFVKTKNARAVALPTTMPMAPSRATPPLSGEDPVHPIYKYAFIADSEEGIVLVDVETLTDGDPENNFFERSVAFNPDGALDGANALTLGGNHAYVLGDRGLTVVDFSTPLEPRIVANISDIRGGRAIDIQFRYAFVVDEEGLKVVDVTFPERAVTKARLPIADARSIYVARTYAYVGGGDDGIVIVDVENPEKPFIDQIFTGGVLRDTNDVKIGSTNASLFAYVADGENGFHVVQLTSPDSTPEYAGFSPRPKPRLIASRHTHGPALAISRGLDRDRAVDESGNQVAVFNRIGARPMNLEEMQRLYLKDGEIYRVSDEPENEARGRSQE
ncbi:MAG: hypothetical protein R3338_01050 [Thermoanaerobaculia bacterium]|nr:hypothetical protein [Thermoanaerobaculia bacterium]